LIVYDVNIANIIIFVGVVYSFFLFRHLLFVRTASPQAVHFLEPPKIIIAKAAAQNISQNSLF
jgi:hypothetical protein